jgi:hypothetical protein
MKRAAFRQLLAAAGALSPVVGWLVTASIVPACGGAHRASAAVDAGPQALIASSDPGSGPFDCSVADPYQMDMIEDFEFGAATGWYTNNELCYPWTQAEAECVDAGVVCFPGSQVQKSFPRCQGPDALPGVWSSCYGTGQVDCSNPKALDSCQQDCLSIQPSPSFLADQLPASPIPSSTASPGGPPGRCGSLYALHVLAGPFDNWGGNIGTRFSVPVNALQKGYDGVAVWMRTAPGFANAARITLSDEFTDSQTNMSLPAAQRACDPNPNCAGQAAQGNSNCYNVGCDPFGAYIPMTENWRLFLLSFDEMRQGGWGKQRPGLDLSNLLSIQISYPVGTWDYWIDDIAFYRLKSP